MPDDQTLPDRRLSFLSRGLAQTGAAVFHLDHKGIYDFGENIPPQWPLRDVRGCRDEDFLPDDIVLQLRTQRADALASGAARQHRFEFDQQAGRLTFEATHLPDLDGTVLVIIDKTLDVQREAAMRTLLREVSHRSKNMLAIVQSVAMQTARHAETIEGYLSGFRGRLQALSTTQDLVTESEWRGTRFRELAGAQLTRVSQKLVGIARFNGPDPLLLPNAALHVGLALHELASNAAAHGALARNLPVEITIAVRAVEEGMTISWTETPVTYPETPNPPRFGTLVLERVVPISVDGAALMTVEGSTLRYTLTLPHSQYDA